MLRIPLLFVLMAALAACAARPLEPAWPEGIPSRSEFSAAWQASGANRELQNGNEYLVWVLRFYEGYNAVPGWLDMTQQVLERLPQEEQVPVAARLYELGARIGAEWAKDNSVRLISTRSAGVWRDALLEALRRNDLDAYLERLAGDVDALLSGALHNDAIEFGRYYEDEFDC